MNSTDDILPRLFELSSFFEFEGQTIYAKDFEFAMNHGLAEIKLKANVAKLGLDKINVYAIGVACNFRSRMKLFRRPENKECEETECINCIYNKRIKLYKAYAALQA